MPSKAANAQTMSEFKRDTAKIAARLKRTGKPMVLTVDGKPAMVVQDRPPTSGCRKSRHWPRGLR